MLNNAMRVLELFTFARTEVGVVEAAELLDRPKSTTSRWLSSMAAAGFLERDADSGRYRISMRLAAFGEVARRSMALQRIARPFLERLAKGTGETANLAVMTGPEAVNVDVVESPRPITHVGWVGRRLPLHASAAGKALLAWHDDPGAIQALVDEPLERYTSRTLTDGDALTTELERVRERGFSIAWAEMEPDMVAAAAPVRDHRARVVAVLAVTAPISRATRERLRSVGATLIAEADDLSAKLGFRRTAGEAEG